MKESNNMKNLEKYIAAFLEGGKKPTLGGGWPEVSESEFDNLHRIITELIRLKYQEDCDGDLPLRYKLIDRTKTETLGYEPLPHWNHDKTNLEKMDILWRARANLGIASNEVDRILQTYIYEQRENSKNK